MSPKLKVVVPLWKILKVVDSEMGGGPQLNRVEGRFVETLDTRDGDGGECFFPPENRRREESRNMRETIRLAYLGSDDKRECCLEFRLPESWRKKSCGLLLEKFVAAYWESYEVALKACDLELLLESGEVVALDLLLEDLETKELVVVESLENERLPVLLVLGEISTLVGFAGEAEPRATVPTYVAEAFVENVLTSTMAAGGSVDELFCKNPGHSEAVYPVSSSHVISAKDEDQKDNEKVITRRGWNDVELIIRHALVRADVDLQNRHVVGLLPSRATVRFKAEFVEFLFRQHDAASVAVVSLAVAVTRSQPTALVVDFGHDSSTAIPFVDGLENTEEKIRPPKTTKKGGALVSEAFHKALQKKRSQREHESSLRQEYHEKVRSLDDLRPSHQIHLDKAKHCFVRSNKEHTRRDDNGLLLGDECFLAAELLFRDDDTKGASSHYESLQRIAFAAVSACEPSRQDELLANIIATGADDACLPGSELRLAQELHTLAKGKKTIRASRITAWTAALRFAALLADAQEAKKWIMSKDEFQRATRGRRPSDYVLKDPRYDHLLTSSSEKKK